jgi:hypothetical protein
VTVCGAYAAIASFMDSAKFAQFGRELKCLACQTRAGCPSDASAKVSAPMSGALSEFASRNSSWTRSNTRRSNCLGSSPAILSSSSLSADMTRD